MFKQLMLILLLIHILGDYYFQTEEIAKQKQDKLSALIKHSILYLVACITVILPIITIEMLISAVSLGISHAVIDFAKYKYVSNKYIQPDNNGKSLLMQKRTVVIFLVDQFAHFICIFIIAYALTANNYSVHITSMVHRFFQVVDVHATAVLPWTVILLLIWKPVNITIKQLLSVYKPNNEEKEIPNDKNTGGFIGLLERLIILMFLAIGQYAAIGLVLTAKSIARYDKIAKQPSFAEYYLLGTLLSTFLVIILYLGIM